MEVVFHFTNNQVNGSIEETIELPEDTSDSEIDELFNGIRRKNEQNINS